MGARGPSPDINGPLWLGRGGVIFGEITRVTFGSNPCRSFGIVLTVLECLGSCAVSFFFILENVGCHKDSKQWYCGL